MDLKKFENFNWIEMDSKDQNLNLTKRINPFPFAGGSIDGTSQNYHRSLM